MRDAEPQPRPAPWPLRALVVVQGLVLLAWLGARLVGTTEAPKTAGPTTARPSAATPVPIRSGDATDSTRESTPRGSPEVDAPAPSQSASPIHPQDPVLYGTIRNTEGEALLEYARVAIYAAAEQHVASADQRDSRGYLVKGVPPGDYQIRAHAEGYREQVEPLTVHADQRAVRRDFDLAPTTKVEVRLVDSTGQNVVPSPESLGLRGPHQLKGLLRVTALSKIPADRRLRSGRPPHAMWHGRGGPEGSYGTLEWSGDLPCHAVLLVRDHIVDTTSLDAGAKLVSLRVPEDLAHRAEHALVVRVTDGTTGEPIAGAAIKVEHGEPVQTSTTGEARFPTVVSYDPSVIVSAEGYATWQRSVGADGNLPDIVDVALTRSRGLRVLVLDPEGEPARANLGFLPARVVETEPPTRWSQNDSFAHADREGVANLEIPTSPTLVRATLRLGRDDYLAAFATVPRATEELTLHLAPASTLELRPETSETLDYLIRDSRGEAMAWGRCWSRRQCQLPSGSYQIEVWDWRGRIRSLPVTVGEPGQRTVVKIPGR